MLLDDAIPRFDCNEVHAIRIQAPAARVFQAVKDVAPGEVPLFLALFWLRGLPARLMSRSYPCFSAHTPLLEQARAVGFIWLAEEADQELVLGVIGRFWKPWDAIRRVADAEEFRAFAEPNYAKAAINFYVRPIGDTDAVMLSTETRIAGTDQVARRLFTRYWQLIHPGSALIRGSLLRAIKKRAERTP